FHAEDGIRGRNVTGVQTRALPIAQASALGPAILGAAAASEQVTGYKNASEIAQKIGQVEDKVYTPNPDNTEVYDKLYEEYKTLHKYFGTGENDVMKRLNKIREERK